MFHTARKALVVCEKSVEANTEFIICFAWLLWGSESICNIVELSNNYN
jgi:hypothetical protein